MRHKIDSQTQQFITLYYFRATCFDSLESSSRPSIEPNQDYLITSALRDPVALTIGGINAVWIYSQVSKMIVGSALVTLRM
jgi:hypothetical protein